MSPHEASKQILSALAVTREDIARAKAWLLKSQAGRTHELVESWLSEQQLVVSREVDTDLPNCGELLGPIARAYSVRLAFYQAVAELVSEGELIPAGPPTSWEASLTARTSRYGGGIPLNAVRCSFPQSIERPPFPSVASTDPDVFLQGINCKQLHPGILEAVDQALGCFRRGLYMPATAMLAAAAEATWTECAIAVAKKLANTKLDAVVNDQLVSISKKVTETRKALEHADGKALLKTAGQHIAKVSDAELWTTTLRDRRTDKTYAQRIGDLKHGGGLNGTTKLIWGTTVHDDDGADTLTGGPGLDWFFANLGPGGVLDHITDRNNGGPEQVN
jgi:hypothetical protein